MLDHLFRDFEIRDHAVAQRANGLNIARCAAKHLLGFVADGKDLLLALDVGDGDDGRLVQDNPLTLDVDQGVGRAEVDGHVVG